MPGKKRACNGCQKVMRSDNLKKHDKICKGYSTKYNRTFDGTSSTSSESVLNNNTKQDVMSAMKDIPTVPMSTVCMKPKIFKTTAGMTDKTEDEESLSKFTDDDASTSDDDSDYVSSDDDEDDYWLWESFAMMCKRSGKDIFEKLKDFLFLYKWSQTDALFQKLMDGVYWAKVLGYRLPNSFNFAVYSNIPLIVEAVKCNREEKNFWNTLSKRRLPPGCKWLTGEQCHCGVCFGHSLLTKVRRFGEIFYGMTTDETIQKILKEEKSGCSLEDAMDRYKEEILEKFEDGQSMLETCGIEDDPNRPSFHCSDEDD